MAKVKVILQADVAGLGEEGDVKDVAGGYARNYLLPRKLVIPATKGNLKILAQQHSQIEQKQEQHRAEAHALADRLAAITLHFPVRVGEQGRLYGSVTGQDIAAQLKSESNIEIDRRLIELKEPLRTLGTFDVPIRVAHAVTAHVQVVVRDQNQPVATRVVAAAAPAVPAETLTVAGEGETPVESGMPASETRPERLGEDAAPLGAASVDTVVPAGETAPEPLAAGEMSTGSGAPESGEQESGEPGATPPA